MSRWNVYLAGAPTPTWSYKTYRGLTKRLETLVNETSIANCKVESILNDGTTHISQVKLIRERYARGWQTDWNTPVYRDNIGGLSSKFRDKP